MLNGSIVRIVPVPQPASTSGSAAMAAASNGRLNPRARSLSSTAGVIGEQPDCKLLGFKPFGRFQAGFQGETTTPMHYPSASSTKSCCLWVV
jgi:hypothetical protein